MELNWTTFILEVINFLVLVWLLKHFLYKPVRETVEKRRQAIEDDLDSARQKKQQMEQALAEQQQKLAQWEAQQQDAKADLQVFIDGERERRLTQLNDEIADEVERRKALAEHQQKEQWRELERRALDISSRFASQLLARFGSPELERLIVAATLEDLPQLEEKQLEKLQQALTAEQTVVVTTVYPLDTPLKQQLQQTLQTLSDQSSLNMVFEQDAALVCGICVTVESMQINANLASELHFFAEGKHCG